MKEKIIAYISTHQLLNTHQPVVVALSGGADSVALLHLLNQLGYPLVAAHCNFHLRAEESDRDEAFVRHLCQSLKVPLKVQHFQTSAHAQENNISIEMAARELRYEWFEQLRTSLNAQCIATAHHQNDQTETLLLNLIRGTGLKGLAAMHPRTGHVVRPLLAVSREEILNYLKKVGQDYVTDSSNLETEFKRNKIRLQLIPLLQEINPSVVQTLSETCNKIRQSLPYYYKGIEGAMAEAGATPECFPLKTLLGNPNTPTLLHEWLRDKGFNSMQISQMAQCLESEPGKMWESHSHRVLKDREAFLLEGKHPESTPVELIFEMVNTITDTSPRYAYFDADLIQKENIHVRPIKEADRFHPFGMKGSRLVSDFLTDLKLTRFQKQQQWVACCGEDIIWVIGLRSDNRFRVTPKTKRILRVTYKENTSHIK